MLESLVVYTSLILVMVVCGMLAARREPVYVPYSGNYLKNEKFLQPEVFFLIAAFTFVFGCRWGVGVDYFHYLFAYEYKADGHFEFLFKKISELLRFFKAPFPVFFSVWAFIQITLLYYALKNYRFIFPFFAFFLICSPTFLSLANVIRQQLAACIFLVSLQFIEKRQPVYFYLCVLLAFCFHRSSILLVVIYPLFRYKADWFSNEAVQIFLYIIALYLGSHYQLVSTYIEAPFRWFASNLGFSRYGYNILNIDSLNNRAQFGRKTGMGIYVSLFRTIPIILLSKDLKRYFNSRFFDMIYTGWFISVTGGLIFGKSIVLYRPFVFFVDFQPLLWSFVVYYALKKQKPVYYLYGILFILLHVVLFLNIVSYGEVNTSAYTFFWQN